MFEFKEITINDIDIFKKYLLEGNYNSSEMTFTNFFMWRDFYNFRLLECKNMLCVISLQEDMEPFAFMPIGNPKQEEFDEVLLLLYEYFRKNNWKLIFKRVDEQKLYYFSNHLNLTLEAVYDRDSSDYVYLAEDLITLKGKKYHGKRNHINSFKTYYEHEYVEFDKKYIDECIRINEEWFEQRNTEMNKGILAELIANKELLNNYEELGCKGALFKIDGKFEGYTIGEKLNQDMAIIHIEKANNEIRGLYNYINQQFCENEWNNTIYINREQDLGIEGLRKAKLSYHPTKMINKYNIFIK